MACPAQTDEVVAAKVTLNVNWPATLANAGCVSPKCNGAINIWLLSQYHINGNAVTGSTTTCGNQTPPIPLTSLGSQSEGLPMGQTATVQVNFAADVWKQIAKNAPPAMATGTLGGWNVGSSLQIDPTTTAYGLKPTSMFAKPATAWPCSQSDIPMADLADDDGDGFPGITGTPAMGNGDYLPATNLMTSPPFAPQADKLFLALRTELRLYGHSTSCTDSEGGAEALLLNNHVVGCHIPQGMTCADSTCNCTAAQWNFIDSNTTVYVGEGVTIPAAMGSCQAGFEPANITGTFQSKILSNAADGGGIDCAAVLAALP
jgi:hypothetical protein